MSRPARFLAALLCLALLPVAPALAVVNVTGDVKPVEPPNPFGLPFGVPGADNDADGVPDYIDSDGNNLLLPSNPNNPNTWLDAAVWVDYDSTQNILVGETGYGLLEINGRTKLRYQHVVLGGSSDGDLDLTTTGGASGADSFDFVQDLIDAASPGVIDIGTGFGDMLVSGTDTVFNNDPNVIGAGEQAAINFANSNPDFTAPVVDLAASGVPATATLREVDGMDGYDMYVGFLSSGRLTVNTGGRVEIQDALMAAVSAGVTGDVFVDGVGTYLAAYGRAELDDANLMSMSPTQRATTSFIGGAGDGTLEVTNGARADFFGGLSIGAATGEAFDTLGGTGSGGTGRVTVMGDTSIATLTAYSSAVSVGNFSFDNDRLALAVGEIRFGDEITDPLGAGETNQDFGRGELEIGEGGRVVTANSSTYQNTNAADARAYVGRNGVVRMRGGELLVATDLINDGEINGYGLVQATTLDTSDNSVLTGGDPNANIASAVAEELRIEINGGGVDDVVFTNRGLVNGLVDLDANGVISNGSSADDGFIGIIETAGTVRASALLNELGSRLVGQSDANGPLRIRLSDATQAGDPAAAGGAGNFGALHNRGEIGGVVDIVMAGGLVNGDNLLPRASPPGDSALTNGGVISATGTITAGSFLNHVDAEVRVGVGESLTILANSEAPTEFREIGAGIPVESGNDVSFRQMNLGAISVDGGELRVGYLATAPLAEVVTGPPDARGNVPLNTGEAFYNARFAVVDGVMLEETSVGTISVNGGVLNFQSGLVNTGVLSFSGGTSTVSGEVYNLVRNYSASGAMPVGFAGAIVVSGDGTAVTFENHVENSGVISIGPTNNVVNFLGDLTSTGTVQVAVDLDTTVSAYITVDGAVNINGGTLGLFGGTGPIDPSVVTATAGDALALATIDGLEAGFSRVLISATGGIDDGSLFTDLVLPEVQDGLFWNLIYDDLGGQIVIELVESSALGADFNGDGVVDESDLAIWTRNAGINSGASLLMGDADLDGDVDLADYDLLSSQLLTGIPVGAVGGPLALATSGAIPEPTTAMLALLASLAGCTRRR